MRVAETTTESLVYAGKLDLPYFEDALQVAAAVACEARVIATRNLRDYARSPIRAMEPQALLKELSTARSLREDR